MYITLDSYYDLDTWCELTCHQTPSNYDVILDHAHIHFLSEEKKCRQKDCKTRSGCHKIFGTPKYTDPPRSIYFEIFGPPLKYLDRVRSACCSRVVNCTKNGRPRLVRSWDDTLLTSCHESGL